MSARLIEALATTGPLAELFSDESVLQAMLDFEVALARAEAHVGVIPRATPEHLAAIAKAEGFDVAVLGREMLRAGTPAIPVVKALTDKVRTRNSEAAGYVHWGATSQDVADTALVLLLKRAQPEVTSDLLRLEKSLHQLSEQHKDTVMLGRTLLQAAPPVTFGLTAAGWLGAIHRSHENLDAAFAGALVTQFGGASGTLAALGQDGIAVARALAEELGLALADAPWHTQRERLATLICACGVLTGSLGKMARDIALLMQNEVSEVAEPGGAGRGGSSTMPHKRNPVACSLTLAAAHRVPGLVASFLSSMVQENERGVGGWQAEWPIVAAVVQSTGLAVASMTEAAEGLSVNPVRMRQNIESTKGAVFAERAMMLLAPKLGRAAAHKLLEESTRASTSGGKHLSEVLAEMPEFTSHIDAFTLRQLEAPEQYLGSAETFRKALLSRWAESEKTEGQKKEQ